MAAASSVRSWPHPGRSPSVDVAIASFSSSAYRHRHHVVVLPPQQEHREVEGREDTVVGSGRTRRVEEDHRVDAAFGGQDLRERPSGPVADHAAPLPAERAPHEVDRGRLVPEADRAR